MKYLLFLVFLFSFTVTQLLAAGTVDLKSIHRILFLGDSITHHSPAPEIGWAGDWGMSASTADHDYVHLFLAKLAAAQGAGAPAPNVWIFGEGGGKISDKVPFVEKITGYKADLALIQLGENDRDLTVEGFQQPYEKLLAAVQAGTPKVRILCVGVWGVWPIEDHVKDKMIRAACEKYGATFVDLGSAFADQATKGEKRFADPAVNWHPGDEGMASYANAFWQALLGLPPAPAASSASAGMPPAIPEVGPAVEVDETWSTPMGLTWNPPPSIVQENGQNVAKISSETTVGAKSETPLNVAKFVGREVTIHTRIKAESVSPPPNPWNGIKLTLRLRNAEGVLDYPDYRPPAGTFDWKDVTWKVRIPDNVVSIDLMIGLENVSGTVWYGAIQISTGK